MKSKAEPRKPICPVCGQWFSTTNAKKIYCNMICTEKGKLRKKSKQRGDQTSDVQNQILKIMHRHRTLLYSACMINERGIDLPLSGIGQAMKGMCKRGLLAIAIRGNGQQKTMYQLKELAMTDGK